MNDNGTVSDTPLSGPPPAEVPLPEAPLVRVIAQVRFPLITSVERRGFIAPFQEAIRPEYPALRPEQSRGVVLGARSVQDAGTNTVWRFNDTANAWCVTLAPDFLALETRRYSSRDDFLERLGRVLSALREHLDPQMIDRLGVRYIDRVTGESLKVLPELVRAEVAGIAASPLAGLTRHSLVESVFDLPDEPSGRLKARWGLLPPRATVDPAAVDAIDEPSWLLDIDAFRAESRPFDVDAELAQARRFAERIYSFFRWAVKEQFLRQYGGEL